MGFEWDEDKNRENIRKHGIDFVDAPQMFDLPMLLGLDDRIDYGEDPWIGIGLLSSRAAVVVYTERAADVVRIISLRKALSHERQRYEKFLADRLGSA